MSKYISLLFIMLLIFFCSPYYNLTDIAQYYDGDLFIYTYQYKTLPNTSIIKNGNSYIIKTSTKNGKKTIQDLDKNKIKGLSFEFLGNEQDIKNIVEKTKLCVKFNEKVNNIVFLYGYSTLFKDYTTYNNEKINMQIAFQNGVVSVGVPLILGSI